MSIIIGILTFIRLFGIMYADKNAFAFFKPFGFAALSRCLPLKFVAKMPLQASIFVRIIILADKIMFLIIF